MENATSSKKDGSDRKESIKSKPRRQPEDLGALAMVSEREIQSSPEKQAPGHVGAAAIQAESKVESRPKTGKNIETMSRAELMVLSEQVVIDGTSLRQIYETHLVGEKGLRRLLAEHFRSGDLKKALRHEIVERQIDFERDPAVRDMAVYAEPVAASSTDSGKAALDKLLMQTDLAADDRGEEAAFFKARALYEADQLLQHKQQRRVIDISVAAVIAVLLLLVLVLLMSRT